MSKKPYVSNEAAEAVQKDPHFFDWNGTKYHIAWKSIVIYDDPEMAKEIAAHLGSYTKHAANKFPESGAGWKTMSIVPLKGDASEA